MSSNTEFEALERVIGDAADHPLRPSEALALLELADGLATFQPGQRVSVTSLLERALRSTERVDISTLWAEQPAWRRDLLCRVCDHLSQGKILKEAVLAVMVSALPSLPEPFRVPVFLAALASLIVAGVLENRCADECPESKPLPSPA